MVNVGVRLRFGCASRKRPNQLLRRALAADGLFQIGEAFYEKQRSDVRHIKIVEHYSLVEIEAFERGHVENEKRPLRPDPILRLIRGLVPIDPDLPALRSKRSNSPFGFNNPIWVIGRNEPKLDDGHPFNCHGPK
jgi:hypothetical protein